METKYITVSVGNISLGPDHPVLIQSMCNVSTMDTEACVDQCIRIFEAGGGLSRITARNVEEARNLKNIRKELTQRGYSQPLSADVHFNPAIALEAAGNVEKVRINPGNFAKADIESPFLEFLEVCRINNTAIRIGVNHGSLSTRILEEYGDTPAGMVESALEYLRICRRENFSNVVVSLKSSNTRVMVYSNRLLKKCMEEENLLYPLHLGVTEAGDGEDGRIRSAAGIGTLLLEGMGDTIRISLTEDPEQEIPVAIKLLEATGRGFRRSYHSPPTSFERRESLKVDMIGGGKTTVVISTLPREKTGIEPDYNFVPDHRLLEDLDRDGKYILSAEAWAMDPYSEENYFPLFDLSGFLSSTKTSKRLNFILIRPEETFLALEQLKHSEGTCCLIYMHAAGPDSKTSFLELVRNSNFKLPVLIHSSYNEPDTEMFQIHAAAELAWYFIDGYADGIWLDNPFSDPAIPIAAAFKILQACRSRMTETEYIACPSCGRTLFNIQETLAEVRKSTSHLKHLKIAVMGCIVNGPGEMADADYGYVGTARGKVSLYRKREAVKKNIPEADAVMELVKLIKENGDWKD